MKLEKIGSGHLDRGDGHKVYFEDWGQVNAPTFLYVHGGPGGGFSEKELDFFNEQDCRVVFFEQRGCGRSEPFLGLENNTTTHLIADIEALRQHLNVDKWFLFGGSWGSTLTLCSAIAHPENVLGLILRGVFFCNKEELKWTYEYGANVVNPMEYEKFIEPVGPGSAEQVIGNYYRLFLEADENSRQQLANTWNRWESALSHLQDVDSTFEKVVDTPKAVAMAVLETHYFHNKAFLDEDDFIIKNLAPIKDIPTEIVQGRFDLICPVKSAWRLHQGLNNSRFTLVNTASHSAHEPHLKEGLKKAVDRILKNTGAKA